VFVGACVDLPCCSAAQSKCKPSEAIRLDDARVFSKLNDAKSLSRLLHSMSHNDKEMLEQADDVDDGDDDDLTDRIHFTVSLRAAASLQQHQPIVCFRLTRQLVVRRHLFDPVIVRCWLAVVQLMACLVGDAIVLNGATAKY
jgi:hypothetical protein